MSPSHEGFMSIVGSRIFIITAVLLSATFFGVAYAWSGLPAVSDRYLSMSTLDQNMMVGSYFRVPNTALPGEASHWSVDIQNHLGGAQLLSLRAKLLSPTDSAPNDTNFTPSSGQMIFEKRMLLADNSTAIVPFDWSIVSANVGANSTSLESIRIGNMTMNDIHAQSPKGNGFSIVFELWTFDESKHDFSNTWSSDSGQKSTWNQIWFSIKK